MKFLKVLFASVMALAVAGVSSGADAAKKRTMVRKASPAAAAAALADAPHDARFERGYICYTSHYHYGSSGSKPTRAAAQAAAASAWSSFVDFEYGSAWASFAKSGSKKMSCTTGSGGWDCSVEARPCK